MNKGALFIIVLILFVMPMVFWGITWMVNKVS